jgi:hypothetical protein
MKQTQLLSTAFFLFLGTLSFAQSSQDLIKINQSGYYPNAPKIAVLTANFSSDEYAEACPLPLAHHWSFGC